jgi:proline iminopeptidase
MIITQSGLAIYSVGDGQPLLLMPYPHGFGSAPIAEGPLAAVLRELGQRVLTFDPPGAFRSTRSAAVTMAEMLACAEETLHTLAIQEPVGLVGHSMGGLCAIAFALTYPERVKRLVLIGMLSGGAAIQRGKGMPWGNWLTGLDRWRFAYWGFRLGWGIAGNLAIHKRLAQLLAQASYVNKALVPRINIAPGDYGRPAPVRDGWPRAVFMSRLDYQTRLGEIRVPTWVGVGRYDPQTPVPCSEELARGIREARLAIFERSAHYPFIEEREQFRSVLGEFLARQQAAQPES